MKTRIATLGLVAATALLLSACSSGAYDTTAPATPDPYDTFTPSQTPASNPTTATAAPAAGATALMTADTSLGTIVVDGSGMTVYMYDSDTQGSGTSTCSGACLSAWPAVPGGDAAPTLTGVTGEVTTITGTDGKPQLALNGWPLYYYVSDSAAGDTTGQGVGGVWWVLNAAGEPVKS